MTNVYSFDGIVVFGLLFICTCAYLKKVPRLNSWLLSEKKGVWGVFYKAAVIGTRLHIAVAISCLFMAFYVIFLKWWNQTIVQLKMDACWLGRTYTSSQYVSVLALGHLGYETEIVLSSAPIWKTKECCTLLEAGSITPLIIRSVHYRHEGCFVNLPGSFWLKRARWVLSITQLSPNTYIWK